MRSPIPGSMVSFQEDFTPLETGFPQNQPMLASQNVQIARTALSPRSQTISNSGVRSFNHQDFQQIYRDKVSKIVGNDIDSVYDDKSKYRGTVVSGMRSGRGEYSYPNGDIYSGLWNNDKFSGIGSYNFNKLGQTYYGDFDNHLMHGRGTLVRNGTRQIIYEGNWQNGLKHGMGTQFYSHNPVQYYEGNWVAGNKQGIGSHMRDGNIYKGEWQNGKRHGKGDFQTRDGVIYSGIWNHDIIDSGFIRYPRGDTYEGQIVNGLRQGRGRYIYSDGQIYEGQYMNDLKHGQGILKKGNVVYNGNFVNDMSHGYGTLISSNGDKYQGQFFEGRKQGPNSFYSWKDGSTFRGSFENDAMWDGTYIDIKDNIPRTVSKGQVLNI